MNSSRTPEMTNARRILSIPSRFNWIDLLAVPLAISVMETQPISAVILFGSLLLTGDPGALSLGEGTIFALILGLSWWSRIVQKIVERDQGDSRARLLFALGLLAALATTIAAHLSLLDNLPALLLTSIVIICLWWISLNRVRIGALDEQLMRSFKIGFFVLLALLFCALDPRYSALLAMLAYALPLFFLSGLVAFSFNRLGQVNEEYLRRSSPDNSIRAWSILLLSLCIVLVSALFALEFPILRLLLAIFAPLRNPLAMFFAWLVSLLDHIPAPKHPPIRLNKPIILPKHVITPTSVSPLVVIIGSLAILVLFAVVIIIVLRAWHSGYRVKGDESHEALSIRTILRARRERRQRRRGIAAPEPLDPTSARAHYRAFLLAMAKHNQDMARRPEETPAEYQTRLLTATSSVHDEPASDDTSPALLDELTSAYVLERYGGKPSPRRRYIAVRKWLARLVRHFG